MLGLQSADIFGRILLGMENIGGMILGAFPVGGFAPFSCHLRTEGSCEPGTMKPPKDAADIRYNNIISDNVKGPGTRIYA